MAHAVQAASYDHRFIRAGYDAGGSQSLDRPNPGSEEALHTYLQVGDSRQIRISGLEGALYADKTANFEHRTQDERPIVLIGETDRVYLNTQTACTVADPVLKRNILVEKEGSGRDGGVESVDCQVAGDGGFWR